MAVLALPFHKLYSTRPSLINSTSSNLSANESKIYVICPENAAEIASIKSATLQKCAALTCTTFSEQTSPLSQFPLPKTRPLLLKIRETGLEGLKNNYTTEKEVPFEICNFHHHSRKGCLSMRIKERRRREKVGLVVLFDR
jgi:hypothetical protein